MKRIARFAVPGVPPSLNRWSRAHWAVRRQMAEDWRGRIALYSPRRLKAVAPVRVSLCFDCGSHAKDADNLSKFILDGLVACGIIPGDGPGSLSELCIRSTTQKPEQTHIMVEWEDASTGAATPKE